MEGEDVEFWDDGGGERRGEDLTGQVLEDDLLIGGLEAEAGRKLACSISDEVEFVHGLEIDCV